MNFAGLKSVSESISNPNLYYDNNVNGSKTLISVMDKYHCRKFIFSSSATVYGKQKYPVDETTKTGLEITNPYGQSKYLVEEILKEVYSTNRSIIILRYFNPIGAHESGLLNDHPSSIPNNIFLTRVA